MMTPEDILAFCNKIREAGGAEQLEELQPGVVGNPGSCLIARNLNFECSVKGAVGNRHTHEVTWGMFSDDPRLVNIAEALGYRYIAQYEPLPEGYIWWCGSPVAGGGPVMLLPDDVRDSAREFDKRNYPSDLYDQHIDRLYLSI